MYPGNTAAGQPSLDCAYRPSRRAPRVKSAARRAAAAVEFAFSITVLLMIVFATIEFARMGLVSHSVDHASYLGARRGMIVGANVSDVTAVVNDHLAVMGLQSASVQVSPNPITDDAALVEVVVSVPVSGNSWISPLYLTGDMTGRTRMLAERNAADMRQVVTPAVP